MKNKIIFAILLAVLIITSTGCWDRREIEELGFVVGIAIDSPGNNNPADKTDHTEYGSRGNPPIVITQQYAIPKALAGGEKGSSSKKLPYANISVEGSSITRIIENFNNVVGRTPDYDHLKVIIISDEVSRSFNLYKLLNALLRHPEMVRTVKIFISEGNARSVLDIASQTEDLPAFNLNMVSRNIKEASNMAPSTLFGEISKKMAAGVSFNLQRVAVHRDIVDVSGTAVVKSGENKLTGWLDEDETEGFNWLTGKTNGGALQTVDDRTGQTIVFRINRVVSKIKPAASDSQISFNVKVELEGGIAEDWLLSADAFNQEFIERLEKAFEKALINRIAKTLDKMQKELKVDTAGFGKQLSIKYPEVWNEVENNWDEQFSRVPIDVSVKIDIREFGRQGSKY
jgi:spore germination protein